MKINITDQFLWDMVYPLFQGADDALNFLLSNKYKQVQILFGDENPVFKKYRKDKNKKNFYKFIYDLKKNNYIKVKNLKGKEAVVLTKKGISKILKASFYFQEKKKRKDGKWIMIIFDIPQKRQKSRNLLRSVLQNLGYKMFQQSVWVTPYDVSDKTEQLLQYYSLDEYVRIFVIEEL